MMGTVSTTYTTPGITSAASKAAQGSPTHIVTSNAGGDLAAHTFSELGLATSGDVSILQGQINSLARRDDKLAEGIAASVALAQPILRSGQHFGMTAGWGGYDSANAVGFSAAGVLADNYFVPAAVPSLFTAV
jgi:trimeric autotransporter adhesin